MTVQKTTRSGVFVEERFARVATIRDGDNAVELKDNRDGTCDLTVFFTYSDTGLTDDLTAYRMDRDAIMALRRAIDGMLIHIVASGASNNA